MASQKEKLLLEKNRITAELEKRANRSQSDPSNYRAKYENFGDDEESNAQEYGQAETDVGVVENLEAELKNINQALLNIDNGKYGLDVETGKLINKKRLEIYPAAQREV